MGAAYEVTGTLTDDESFGFSMELKDNAGGSLVWAEYAFVYEARGCGAVLALDEANGITIDEINDVIMVDAPTDYRFRPGQYRHGFRATHLPSGKTTQIFDGSLAVTEGNFS